MGLKINQIYGMDCVAGLARLQAGSVDLAFADPPFNIGYEYDAYEDRKAADVYLDWSKQWMQGVARVLKPTGTFWLAIGDEYAAELKVIATRELGLACRNWVVWYYTFGVHCKMKFTRSHAHLLYFVKDRKTFTFNDSAIRVPSARQLVYADKRADPKGRLPDDTWILRPQDLPDGFKGDQDTWYFPRCAGRSRSGPAGTAARCPSSSSAGSSGHAPTRATSCSTPSAAAAPPWRWPRSSAVAGSASSCQRNTLVRSRAGSSRSRWAILSMAPRTR
jgi:hypothetical protein